MTEQALPNLGDRLLSSRDLLALLQDHGDHRVSIYLPTEKAGPATRENPIRLKNLLASAEEQLVAAGLRHTLALDLLAPGRNLVDDHDFWQHQDAGLALLLTPAGHHVYRLPLPSEQLALVADRFHLRPLLPMFTENAFFYVLALSMNQVRVIRCTRFGEQEVRVEHMPHNMAAVLWPNQFENQSQFHTTGRGGGEAVFHLAGDNAAEQELQLSEYFRAVDAALVGGLTDSQAPLVLAAVEHELPIYRSVSHYAHIAEQAIIGNPEQLRPHDLREQAWPLVEPVVRRAETAAVDRFRQQAGTGLTSDQVEEVVREAGNGRVDTLLLAAGGEVWGSLSDDGQTVSRHEQRQPGDYDLVDLAAARALTSGGKLHVLASDDMPSDSLVAAIYRY